MRQIEITLARCVQLGPGSKCYADADSCLQCQPPGGKLPRHGQSGRSHFMKRRKSGATLVFVSLQFGSAANFH